jgi:hypothetical protein
LCIFLHEQEEYNSTAPVPLSHDVCALGVSNMSKATKFVWR